MKAAIEAMASTTPSLVRNCVLALVAVLVVRVGQFWNGNTPLSGAPARA